MNSNPALSAFAAAIETELVFGQVLIRREGHGFALRHVADRSVDAASLRSVGEKDFRSLAQFTADGAFRPLKSAPTLAGGWHAALRDEAALGSALNQLYPGAVADWFAAQAASPPVTSYRDFTGRQTGMYRITTHLKDAAVGALIQKCCQINMCVKRRLWTVDGLAPDTAESKSLLPCLEPCAILLEAARKAARAAS